MNDARDLEGLPHSIPPCALLLLRVVRLLLHTVRSQLFDLRTEAPAKLGLDIFQLPQRIGINTHKYGVQTQRNGIQDANLDRRIATGRAVRRGRVEGVYKGLEGQRFGRELKGRVR